MPCLPDPSLDEVVAYVVADGLLVRKVRLGRLVPFAARPMASRSHVTPLRLEPGQKHELMLRVATASSMIVPVRFMKRGAASMELLGA